jgi:hypothetical protein
MIVGKSRANDNSSAASTNRSAAEGTTAWRRVLPASSSAALTAGRASDS